MDAPKGRAPGRTCTPSLRFSTLLTTDPPAPRRTPEPQYSSARCRKPISSRCTGATLTRSNADKFDDRVLRLGSGKHWQGGTEKIEFGPRQGIFPAPGWLTPPDRPETSCCGKPFKLRIVPAPSGRPARGKASSLRNRWPGRRRSAGNWSRRRVRRRCQS